MALMLRSVTDEFVGEFGGCGGAGNSALRRIKFDYVEAYNGSAMRYGMEEGKDLVP